MIPADGRANNRAPDNRGRAVALRREARRIVAENKFGGGFDIPDDVSPAEIVLEELRRTAGFVRWVERKIGEEWPDTLMPMYYENIDMKGVMQQFPTEAGAWLEVWGRERDRLLKAAKTAHDCGIEERAIRIAEQQSEMMFKILDAVFTQLNLNAEQLALIPTIVPQIIRGEVLQSEL